MNTIVRRLAIAGALVAAIAPAALAGGANAKVWGPGKDGAYIVQTYLCAKPSALRIRAWAEGLVDGQRQTVPIRIERTHESGVFKFARAWPARGTWAIRMELGDPLLPVNVTALDEHRAVKTNKTIWEGDGREECLAILNGEDC
jgi:hypothetical protein